MISEMPPELLWFKSSYSDSSNPNDCVEVATSPGTVHVRDSKNVHGPASPSPPPPGSAFFRTPPLPGTDPARRQP